MVVQTWSGLLWLLFSTLLSLDDITPPNNYKSITTTTTTTGDDDNYAVVFDAGSTGSRVHVFRFSENMNLVPMSSASNSTIEYEYFLAVKPGLSSYEMDPNAAALSLKPLLDKAQSVIPDNLLPKTPVKLGATAGLRLLPGTEAEAILEAVRNLLEEDSKLYYKPEWVDFLTGTDEGAYMWMTINYLSEKLGHGYTDTVGVVDLGGGSVQMAYAISDKSATNAPPAPDGDNPYVLDRVIMGSKYNLYVHSYLGYGLMAARAEILKLTSRMSGGEGNPCITNGYNGTYTYGGVVYDASPPATGTDRKQCMALVRKALKLDAPCPYSDAQDGCSFNGVWSGGGGAGQKDLYIASYFYDMAAQSGVVPRDARRGSVRPIDYLKAANKACVVNVENANSTFPYTDSRDVPYLCMDLVYEYTLLVNGFGINPLRRITVLKEVRYKGTAVEAAWPLGCAVDLLSSLK